METKVLEVRDRATFLPVLAIVMVPELESEAYLLKRAGFGPSPRLVTVINLENSKSNIYPENWGENERTMTEAHRYIQRHFDELQNGSVVDVEFILGEVDKPKRSEIIADRLCITESEWLDKIDELAGGPRVRAIAVNNFLRTLPEDNSIIGDMMNLDMDAKLYKWNRETKEAIRIGISFKHSHMIISDSEIEK